MASPRSARSRLRPLLLLAIAAATGACREAREPPPAPEPAVTPATYSPFVVRMTSEAPFELISFKDVGMSVDPEAVHLVHEEVAESLSAALAHHGELPMSSEVQYAIEMADAANHLACGAHHIYVDMWTPAGAERWGYSLWSGCSERDRFAMREVERRDDADIDALTTDIAASLRRAVVTGCFLQQC